jgi:hypothetical protein
MSELNPQAGGEAPSADPPPADQDGDEASVPDVSPLAAATAELDRLPDVDIAEHPDVYQRIHADLQSALSAIDDA